MSLKVLPFTSQVHSYHFGGGAYGFVATTVPLDWMWIGVP